MIPHNRIRSALRLLWMRSPERAATKRRAKVGRGLYRCDLCLTNHTKIQIDHLTPCGSTPGSKRADPEVTWDIFIRRLFCPAEGLQALCEGCHSAKTYAAILGPVTRAS